MKKSTKLVRYFLRILYLYIYQNSWRTVVFLLSICLLTTSQAQVASPLYTNPNKPLIVHNVDGSTVNLRTVVVSSRQDQARGLMHVKHLPANHSMLFLNEEPREVSMWMKHTYLSLDMWFVLPNWEIGAIARDTEPHSTESIPFDKPAIAVVEVNAGLSDLFGVTEGAKIEFSRNSD